jgi:membrane-associated phospholipid phosphatase
VYTSSLGTHTFFLTFLPACFFFGYDQFGRGLLLVLALGVYTSSFVKDLFCVPRPFAPPVTRLTISTHHLEYGFPSTHSTNSISIALFIFTHVHRLAASPTPSPNLITTLAPTGDWSISKTTYWISTFLLAWYTFSIVYGRLYTAMHSLSDCAIGVVMGAVIWAVYWVTEDLVESWLINAGWIVPMTIIPLALIMVNQHPVPVDDCPCFEDAIAFVSVLMGSLLGRWHAVQNGFDQSFFSTSMPGSGGSGLADRSMWWSIARLKMFSEFS